MNTQLNLILAVWRSSRIGWVGLLIIFGFLWIPAGMVLGTGEAGMRGFKTQGFAAFNGAQWVFSLAFLPAVLLGGAWNRLMRQGASLLQPRFQEAAMSAGLLQSLLVWIAAGVPIAVLAAAAANAMGHSSEAWAWILATAGLTAAVIGVGLVSSALPMTSPRFGLMGMAAIGVFVLPIGSALSALSDSARLLAFGASGVAGCVALAWSLRHIYSRLILGGSPALDEAMGLAPDAAARDESLNEIREPSSAWKQLWMPTQSGKHDLGFWAGVGFAAGSWLLLMHTMAWPVAAVVLFIAGSASMPGSGLVWASPRLAVLPSGLQRTTTWRQLSLMLAQRCALRLLVVPTVVMLGALTWQAPLHELLALGIACVAALLLNAAFVMAYAPSVRSATVQGLLGFFGSALVLMCMALSVLEAWPLPSADPWALPLRAATIALWAVLLSAGLALCGHRAWARMDWAQQPAVPPLAQRLFGLGKTAAAR